MGREWKSAFAAGTPVVTGTSAAADTPATAGAVSGPEVGCGVAVAGSSVDVGAWPLGNKAFHITQHKSVPGSMSSTYSPSGFRLVWPRSRKLGTRSPSGYGG